MPRRATPDPTAKAVGERIRRLRTERGITAERLAFESELGSKGFLSDIESGRARPSLQTLQVIAEYLEVLLVDLLTFPENTDRERLIDQTRFLSPGVIRRLLRDMTESPKPPRKASAARETSGKEPARADRYPRGREPSTFRVADSTAPSQLGRRQAPPGAKRRSKSRGTRQ